MNALIQKTLSRLDAAMASLAALRGRRTAVKAVPTVSPSIPASKAENANLRVVPTERSAVVPPELRSVDPGQTTAAVTLSPDELLRFTAFIHSEGVREGKAAQGSLSGRPAATQDERTRQAGERFVHLLLASGSGKTAYQRLLSEYGNREAVVRGIGRQIVEDEDRTKGTV